MMDILTLLAKVIDVMSEVVFFVIAGIIVALIIKGALSKPQRRDGSSQSADEKFSRKMMNNWMAAADNIKAVCHMPEDGDSKYPELIGSYAGMQYNVSCHDDDMGIPSVSYVLNLKRAPGEPFKIIKADRSVFMRESARMMIIPTEEIFGTEQTFFICAANPETFKKNFTRNQLDLIKELMLCYDRVMISNDTLIVEEDSVDIPDTNIIEYLAQEARALSSTSSAPIPVYEKYAAKDKFEKTAAAPSPFQHKNNKTREDVSAVPPIIIPAVASPFPKNDPFTIKQQEIKVTEVKAPEIKIPEVKVEIPEIKAEESIVEPIVPAVAEDKTASPPDAESQCENPEVFASLLFSTSFPGQAEQEIFDKYVGCVVTWSGILKNAYEFSSDFTFNLSTPGIKASFQIAEVTGSYGMKSKISAVAVFPQDAIAKLKNANGQTFTFKGTLMKFEGFAKEIYIKDAELI